MKASMSAKGKKRTRMKKWLNVIPLKKLMGDLCGLVLDYHDFFFAPGVAWEFKPYVAYKMKRR